MIVPGTTPIADPSRRSSCFYSGCRPSTFWYAEFLKERRKVPELYARGRPALNVKQIVGNLQ